MLNSPDSTNLIPKVMYQSEFKRLQKDPTLPNAYTIEF